ncbi:MAG TPA: CBS domain-containing protein, partial [Bacteroidia bacterium]|nr:CBS domain-containing protein [Bacteroidia bacterium]
MKYTVNQNITAREALRQINDYAIPNMALFVVDASGKAIGTVSDGDIRRGLLNELSIQDPLTKFMNTSFRYFVEGENNNEKMQQAKTDNIRFVPMLDKEFCIRKIIDL